MSVGTCFLRARVRHDSLVIVCAQLYDYHGTSVTNAIEEVREAAIVQLHDDVGLQHLMPARKWWQRKPVREEVLANAAALSTIIEHWPKGGASRPPGLLRSSNLTTQESRNGIIGPKRWRRGHAR